jgi:hypothetical protein
VKQCWSTGDVKKIGSEDMVKKERSKQAKKCKREHTKEEQEIP